MAAARVYLAVDIGASSGRVVAGLFNGTQLELREIHRFPNGPVHVVGRLYWDLFELWAQIQNGLRLAAEQYGPQIRSVGVDTWGVDFGLLGKDDELLGMPRHYRDPRTQGAMDQAFRVVPRREIFQATGLQFMELNTLYQLLAMQREGSPLLPQAESFLMMPDLFHWLMTGIKTNEFTNATTTQFLDPQTGDWARDLLTRFNLPTHMLGPVTPPGTNLGKLREEVAAATGLSRVDVILPGTHDTASAVLAVPSSGSPSKNPAWCYISSGTWSLMGAEIPEPVINDACQQLNFTNEGGVGHTIRLLKNIAGLWLVQECRRIWSQQGRDYNWTGLTQLAAAEPPLLSIVDPDDPTFVAPRDMPQTIRDFCHRTSQVVPDSDGAVIRCVSESLALRYRLVLQWLEQLTGGQIQTIHIVGGGTQNRQLCQMAADACARPVVAGPVEATAIGNLMMQAIAAGDVESIEAARDIVRRSFDVQRYEPRNCWLWDEPFARLQSFLQ